jgi:hypothetical protein
MSKEAIFSAKTMTAWIAGAAVMFIVSLYLMAQGESNKSNPDAIGPSTFSRSAIGYAGIAELLQQIGVPVIKSQYNSVEKLRPGGVLVIAEPPASSDILALIEARTVLLILPKWRGLPSKRHRGWIGSAELKLRAEPQRVLDFAVLRSEVVLEPVVPEWTANRLGPKPSVDPPIQVIRSDRLRPIVAAGPDILLGEISDGNRRLWVLADPDVVSNHGLVREGNDLFAVALVNALRQGAAAVVFDETVHGFASRPPSPFRLLFEFPFVFVTVHGALAVLLLLWATIARFGAPETAPPPLSAGRQQLIQNAAALLAYAGHHQVMIQRYVQATIRDVAQKVHAPRGLSDGALTEWLGRVGRTRGVDIDCGAVLRRTEELTLGRQRDLAPLVPLARDIHQWRLGIIDGPSGHPGDHRQGARGSPQGGGRAG